MADWEEHSKEYRLLYETLLFLAENKPNDRSETARRYAVTITEMEKVLAYFWTYVEMERMAP